MGPLVGALILGLGSTAQGADPRIPSHSLSPATHVVAAQTHAVPPAHAHPSAEPSLRPAVHVASPATVHHVPALTAATGAHAGLGAVLRLAPPRLTTELSGPSEGGYAQQGSSSTPWGGVSSLAPKSEEKTLWRFANRQNPGYSKDGKDRFITNAPTDGPSARHVNCVLASLTR